MTASRGNPEHRLRLCVWEITEACNLRCVHCIVTAGRRGADELTTEEAFGLVDALAAEGCRTVALSGGEPLMRPDWHLIAERVISAGMNAVLASNGLLIDDAAVARITGLGVRGVAISLDGTRETHEAIRGKRSYDRAVSAIRRLVAAPVETAVMTQIHKDNLRELDEMYRTIVALGVDRWQLQIAVPAGRMLALERAYLIQVSDIPPLAAKIAELSRRREVIVSASDNIGYYSPDEPELRKSRSGEPSFWTGCQAGLVVVGITPNGGVKGCPSLPAEFLVGNVRERPFAEIWDDDEGFAYTRRWDQDKLVGGCAECPYARICRAGCTCMAYMVTGTVHDNPFCIQRT